VADSPKYALCTAHDVMLILDGSRPGLTAPASCSPTAQGIEADVTLLGKSIVRRLLPDVGRARTTVLGTLK
jgi:hypothetical protein